MCGLPFSGKTTLSKKIAEKTGAKMIAFDWIWAEKEKELSPDLPKIQEWQDRSRQVYKRIRHSLTNGESVVYDDISVRREHRESLRKIAQESNANFMIVYLNIPMSEIKKREAGNKISKERHDVASINFNNALKQWQSPMGEEGVVELKNERNINAWLNNIGPI